MSSKELFDKKFVNVMWDDSLEGKEGFFADYIDTLIERVNNNIRGTVVERVNSITGTVDTQLVFGFCSYGAASFPFLLNGTHYRFFYYDPNYSCKRAYMEGKVIQFRNNSSDSWIVVSSPSWIDRCEYRVKPESTETSEQCKLRVYKCSDDTLHISPHCITTDFLFEGTEGECKQYVKEHYCDKCAHQSCDMVVGTQFCEGFKEPKQEDDKSCGTCKYKELQYTCSPCDECNGKSMWEPRKPKKRLMTNRELAKWIAQGNGQVKHCDGYCTLIACTVYDIRDDDKPCPDYLVIRGWDETEWHEPEVEE